MNRGLYSALLHLYPAAFRAEYGEEMRALFAQRLRDAANPAAVAGLWIEAAADTLVNALRVHLDILRQDLRYTTRTLGRSMGFTITAICVIALGVGANTAAFSLADHVLIRPLPFADADRLVKLWEDQSPGGYSAEQPSPANYRDWKRMNTSFEAMAAHTNISVNLAGQGEPERIEGTSVTADLLPALGARPVLGRTFSAADDGSGAPGTLILSEGLWKRRFGADPNALGTKVVLDGEPYTIIGVMPAGFSFPNRAVRFWTPIRFNEESFEDRTNNYLFVTGKLKRGVSIEQAQAEMHVVAARLQRAYPKENAHTGVTISRLRDEVSQRSRLLLAALVGAAMCVLLIACTNLANLFLARALARRQELAVRTAMGAGRERLIRQLLTESVVLALGGSALGVALAGAALPLLARLVPNNLPIAELPAMDWRVLGIALLLAAITGIGFGILPAIRASSTSRLIGLREGARSGVGGRKERLRSTLVITEVSGSVVLLVLSGLLIRALWHIQATDPGFRSEGLLKASRSRRQHIAVIFFQFCFCFPI
jgi:predicted permease